LGLWYFREDKNGAIAVGLLFAATALGSTVCMFVKDVKWNLGKVDSPEDIWTALSAIPTTRSVLRR
jgi:hypothetical protein